MPVPAVIDEYPAYLKQAFLLFKTEANAFLQHVHIYDGARQVQAFNDVNVDGDFTASIVPKNTFVLRVPHAVQRGIGLSFFIQGRSGPGPNRLIVPAIGAEYNVSRPILANGRPAL